MSNSVIWDFIAVAGFVVLYFTPLAINLFVQIFCGVRDWIKDNL